LLSQMRKTPRRGFLAGLSERDGPAGITSCPCRPYHPCRPYRPALQEPACLRRARQPCSRWSASGRRSTRRSAARCG